MSYPPPKRGYVSIEEEFDGGPHRLIDFRTKRDEGYPLYFMPQRKKCVHRSAYGWGIVFEEEGEVVKSDDVDVELLGGSNKKRAGNPKQPPQKEKPGGYPS